MCTVMLSCSRSECRKKALLQNTATGTVVCSHYCLLKGHVETYDKDHGNETVLIPVTIERVIDGDTVVDSRGNRYRLVAIDAPELRQLDGERSKHALEDLLHNYYVAASLGGRDKYRRTLATLYTSKTPDFENTVNVNEQMIADGWAWSYDRSGPKNRLLSLETKAREKRRGIWSSNFRPQLPRDYRRARKRSY